MMFASEVSPRFPKYENENSSIITSSRSLNLEPAKQSRFMVSSRKIEMMVSCGDLEMR